MTNLAATAKYSGWLSRLTSALSTLTHSGPRQGLLDVRTLSDHLKRDMGFLDGNVPGKHS